MISRDQLIDCLYQSLLGESDWKDFAAGLAQLLPGGRSTIFYHDVVRQEGGFALTSGFDDGDTRQYNDYYARINPWMPKAAVRPVGLGVVADQMLEREALVRSEFYDGFLRPLSCESGIGLTVEREAGRCSW